ncbi:MAG: hypothetical protein Q9222_005841 [Ikaeria aurantiellina]
MCCWPFVDVVLEDPPKKEEEKKEYALVSDQLNLMGPVQPAPAYHPHAQLYYSGQPLPEPTKIWYGSTKAQVDAQNAAMAHSAGAYKPMQLTPVNPGAAQQFWCLEPNHRDYTLRTMTDIETSCQPGAWHTASTGYPYFIRNKAG